MQAADQREGKTNRTFQKKEKLLEEREGEKEFNRRSEGSFILPERIGDSSPRGRLLRREGRNAPTGHFGKASLSRKKRKLIGLEVTQEETGPAEGELGDKEKRSMTLGGGPVITVDTGNMGGETIGEKSKHGKGEELSVDREIEKKKERVGENHLSRPGGL